jgi:hypothetical protein
LIVKKNLDNLLDSGWELLEIGMEQIIPQISASWGTNVIPKNVPLYEKTWFDTKNGTRNKKGWVVSFFL